MIDGCEKMAKDNSNNIDDLTERAKVLAEATGRDESDVLADLLDDGILNNSHLNPEKDLVTQLKEAAALITTVQEINTDISNNKVLNGGDNATSVKVETTLEGDIVDRAIASAQKKAENLKTLIATIIPIFLLITGGSMEAFGVINIFSDDETTPAQECNYGIDWVDWTWVSDELNVFGELWTDCDTNDSDSLDNMVVMANAFDTGVPSQEWVLGNIDSFNWYLSSIAGVVKSGFSSSAPANHTKLLFPLPFDSTSSELISLPKFVSLLINITPDIRTGFFGSEISTISIAYIVN